MSTGPKDCLLGFTESVWTLLAWQYVNSCIFALHFTQRNIVQIIGQEKGVNEMRVFLSVRSYRVSALCSHCAVTGVVLCLCVERHGECEF